MQELWNLVKGHAAHGQQMMGQNRWGLVTAVRSTDQGYDCQVLMQPDGIGSAWLPVLTAFGGSGWGLVARPSVGMQVLIAPDTGDGHHGVVTGMAWSTQAEPPIPPTGFRQEKGSPVADGEFAIVSKAQAVFRMCEDGSIYIKAPTVNLEGNLNVLGNIVTQGNISAVKDPDGNGGNVTTAVDVISGRDSTAVRDVRAGGNVFDVHGLLDLIRQIFNRHIHGTSAGPTPPIPE